MLEKTQKTKRLGKVEQKSSKMVRGSGLMSRIVTTLASNEKGSKKLRYGYPEHHQASARSFVRRSTSSHSGSQLATPGQISDADLGMACFTLGVSSG